MTTFIVPDKGRNARYAMEAEFEPAPAPEQLLETVNESGKTAARTGDGFNDVIEDVADTDALRMELRGSRYPRAVIDTVERGPDRIEGVEDPIAAIEDGPDRFYAGYDRLIEAVADGPDDIDLGDGLAGAADHAAQERGYELVEGRGDPVTWAVLESDPDAPTDRYLVPEAFEDLAGALLEEYRDTDAADSFWDAPVTTATYEDVRTERGLECADEERLIAATDPGTAGIYMVVSGATADEYDLAYEPVMDETVSRLGRFERAGGGRDA